MTATLDRRLAFLLNRPEHLNLLTRSLHGIERESLRVDQSGRLALTPHPAALGAALTHPRITTDFSEALIELITGTHADHGPLLQELTDIHRFVHDKLGDEVLWTQSVPCELPAETDIPVGYYGTSNIGRLKAVYRQGLAHRYGKAMQCIAGLHFNFSFAEPLLAALGQGEGCSEQKDRQSQQYVSLIRNFNRYSWLLMYLFGASPAIASSFMADRPHALEALDATTLYLPYATSLRMSDLGYQNKVQSGLRPCYNDLTTYVLRLYEAVSQPWPDYEKIGVKRNGEWLQLNANVLQIENEYYSSIRPKRVAASGERPLHALAERGIQYVEVRCLDVDPFSPIGINASTTHFLDAFLLYCMLEDSPLFAEGGHCTESAQNFMTVVKRGREPGLTLNRQGVALPMRQWAEQLLTDIGACAQALDQAYGGTAYASSVAQQRDKVEDVALTPSARFLSALKESGLSLQAYTLALSQAHARTLRDTALSAAQQASFQAEVEQSLEAMREQEQAPQMDFDAFVEAYQSGLDLH